MRIRPVTAAELPALQDIERAAGEPFRYLGMAAIADDEPPTIEELDGYRRAGHAWIAVDDDAEDSPVAYLIAYLVADPLPGTPSLHIEQVTVHPRAARRGVGRALIEYAGECAREEGAAALTLTTFTDVPWNAPYYARIGFRPLADAELTPALRDIRAHEAELGLDRWPRLCMRRDLTGAGAGVTPRTAP
ncbi:GNAT family N-acetyltransferase [Streptomyces venezuelae]|uniref:GNAT family N-acetyltransferase n=1 Tax=Streptomyces venezuelae TaxID=54571 RepID=A0A5P2BTG6_STRVZ|nr:GNAT family N-acetyltransferase [Streptomyces venezuelae]QES33250.1 GNAT family N-acetyltransferase [Streptomyces venezuelae]